MAAPEPATAQHDVVLVLSYTSWSGAARRGWIMPEDRLAVALTRSPRVRRLLVCNPYRSVMAKLVGPAVNRADVPFPASATRRLHEPVRLRRSDPTAISAIERSCASYERGVLRAARALDLERPAVIATHPLIAGFGRFDWAGPVTYYTNDDLTAHPPLRPWWPAYHVAFDRMRAAGRRAVALTPKSLGSVSPSGPSAIIPCGVEAAEWLEPAEAPAWFLALPRPRLLYVGALDARIDLAAVQAVAKAHPSGAIALVGPGGEGGHLAPIEHMRNVTIHPPVPRRELVGIAAAADAGLIPHVRTAQTEAMSPLKLYEYLAAGQPVAAVDLPGITAVRHPRVAIAASSEEFVSAVSLALAIGPAEEDERKAFIRDNDWERRFDALLDVALDG